MDLHCYEISNLRSGHCFGVYEGATALDAYNAMLDDAGEEEPATEIPEEIAVVSVEA